MQPTQKEAGLLKDLKDQEQLCVDKYRRHAASANDPQLKNLFEQLAQVEQQHLDAIAQMMQGTVCKPADSATVPGHVHGRIQQRRLAAKAKRLLPLLGRAHDGKARLAPVRHVRVRIS